MAGFDTLIAQNRAVDQLKSALTEERIPNAFLFYGEEGVGKKTAAYAFAMACNCDKGLSYRGKTDKKAALVSGEIPCGRCRACKKILSGNHPDIHIVAPSGDIIRIDQILSLCSRLKLKPNEARLRVAIIACADTMNERSANALLKELEEPPQNTLFILTAKNSGGLLQTIISRCRPIRFNPIPQKRLASFLMDRHGLEADTAGIVATLANGSISRALSIKDGDWRSLRNWIIDILEDIDRQDAARRFLFAKSLAEKKKDIGYILAIMKTWYRDLAVFAHDQDAIINHDIPERIKKGSVRFDEKKLIACLEAIEDCEQSVSANADLLLALDALLLRLSGIRAASYS